MRTLILLSLIIAISFSSCMQFRKSDKKIKSRFQESGVEVEIVYDEIEGRRLRYVKTGIDKQNLIIFIHGAPGSSQDYYQFLEDSILLENFKMISIDRPGYGYSGFGDSEKSILRQSELILKCLKPEIEKSKKVIVVGHSFGGPIAGFFAAQNDLEINLTIMLAPANDPKKEKVYWITYLVEYPPFSWLTPKAWKVAADEKLSHSRALEQLAFIWPQISQPIVHIHGTKDILVPFETIDFSREKIDPKFLKIIDLKDVNHFLPWSHTEYIRDLIANEI